MNRAQKVLVFGAGGVVVVVLAAGLLFSGSKPAHKAPATPGAMSAGVAPRTQVNDDSAQQPPGSSPDASTTDQGVQGADIETSTADESELRDMQADTVEQTGSNMSAMARLPATTTAVASDADDMAPAQEESPPPAGEGVVADASVPPATAAAAAASVSAPVDHEPTVPELKAKLAALQAELDARAACSDSDKKSASGDSATHSSTSVASAVPVPGAAASSSKPAVHASSRKHVAQTRHKRRQPRPIDTRAGLIHGDFAIINHVVQTGVRWDDGDPRPELQAVRIDPQTVELRIANAKVDKPAPATDLVSSQSQSEADGYVTFRYTLGEVVQPKIVQVSNGIILQFVPQWMLPVERPWEVLALSGDAAVIKEMHSGTVATVIAGSHVDDLGTIRRIDKTGHRVMTDAGIVSEANY